MLKQICFAVAMVIILTHGMITASKHNADLNSNAAPAPDQIAQELIDLAQLPQGSEIPETTEHLYIRKNHIVSDGNHGPIQKALICNPRISLDRNPGSNLNMPASRNDAIALINSIENLCGPFHPIPSPSHF